MGMRDSTLSHSQGLMVVLLTTHRMSGVRSSGLPFVFWLVMSLYGAVKMRTLALIAEDNVRGLLSKHFHCYLFSVYVLLCTFVVDNVIPVSSIHDGEIPIAMYCILNCFSTYMYYACLMLC